MKNKMRMIEAVIGARPVLWGILLLFWLIANLNLLDNPVYTQDIQIIKNKSGSFYGHLLFTLKKFKGHKF